MPRYHNGPNGPGICSSDPSNPNARGCKYGDSSEHFESQEKAQEAYEKKMESEYGAVSESQSKSPKKLNDNGFAMSYDEMNKVVKEKFLIPMNRTNKNKYKNDKLYYRASRGTMMSMSRGFNRIHKEAEAQGDYVFGYDIVDESPVGNFADSRRRIEAYLTSGEVKTYSFKHSYD